MPQEPYEWPSVAKYASASLLSKFDSISKTVSFAFVFISVSRTVLAARYSLVNYYYTLLYVANQQGGTGRAFVLLLGIACKSSLATCADDGWPWLS